MIFDVLTDIIGGAFLIGCLLVDFAGVILFAAVLVMLAQRLFRAIVRASRVVRWLFR